MTLDSTGLTIKTQPEIYDDIVAEIRASPNLNPNGRINLGVDSLLGIITAIFSDKIAELYQVIQGVYSSQYLAGAEGASLDLLCALNDVTRLPASASTAIATATGVNGTSITAGTIIRDPSRSSIDWVVVNTRTISGGTATLELQASVTGPTSANAGTLTEIVTPISGFNSVTNALDATLGMNAETDEALRKRYVELLSTIGTSSIAAIRSALIAVAGVTEAYVFENFTNAVNAYNVPPHCIEAVVSGGAANDIAQAILDNKAAGIGTYTHNANSGTAQDDNLQNVTINFSRPETVNCYIYAEIIKDDTNTAVSSELETALVNFGNTNNVGQSIVRSKFIGVAYGVEGVSNVRRLAISRTGTPTGASPDSAFLSDISIAFREKASFDSSRCDIVFV
jgi:uncharacterized phage protein gp47/JayE